MRFDNGVIHDNNFADKSLYYSLRYVREIKVLDENDEQSAFNTKFTYAKEKDYAAIHRTLYKDGYFNTLCLPFSISTLSGTPLDGAEVYEFTFGVVENNVLKLEITEVAEGLTQGVPYLIRWTSGTDITGTMSFTGVTWDNNNQAGTDPGSTGVKYHGFYYKTHLSDATDGAGNHYNLFLGADDELYWPTDGGDANAKMKGFRAHFYIVTGGVPTGSPSAAPWRGMPAMLRIVSRDNTVTGTEQVEIQQAVEKAIRDGRIVLIIDGETYNMGGQRL